MTRLDDIDRFMAAAWAQACWNGLTWSEARHFVAQQSIDRAVAIWWNDHLREREGAIMPQGAVGTAKATNATPLTGLMA